MKKLISLLFVLAMCLCLVACGEKETEPTPTPTPEITEAVNTPTPVPTVDTSMDDLGNAKDYIRQMYKDKSVVTPSDYDVVGTLTMKGKKFNLTWTVEVKTGNKADVNVVVGDPYVTIDVNEKAAEEVTYDLKVKISDDNGNSVETKFAHSIPAYKEFTWAEYVAAAAEQPVVVKGVVTALIGKSKGNSSNCIYMQDNDGGYYVYGMTDDPADLGIKEGYTIRVTGVKDIYSGTHEIKNASVEILDTTVKTVEPVDYTERAAKATSLKDADLVAQQAMLVTVKGVEVADEDASSGYYNFKLASGLKSYIRISSSVCPIVKADQETLKANHAANFGYLVDATGVLCVYDGAFYLTPVTVDAFSNYRLPELPAAEKVAKELDGIVDYEILEDVATVLATEGATFKDVAFTWAMEEAACATLADGKLTVTLPEEATTITLTVTAVCGDVTETKTITVSVDAAATDLYVAKAVEAPVVGESYKYVIFQNLRGEVLYFSGEMTSDGKYLATTDKANKAVDVQVEEVEGGFRLFFTKEGTKMYIDLTEGKGYIALTETPYEVFTWNEEAKTLVGVNSQKYLGTYKTYNTFSASAVSYITGENASSVDATQFPSRLCKLAPAALKNNIQDVPVVGENYKYVIFQNLRGEVLYFSGEMTSDGKYLATTDKVDKAVDVQVEEVEGGYRLFFMDGEKKMYIDLTEGKGYIAITETPYEVFTWNEEAKTLVGVNSQKYLGTYKTYNTFSASAVSYITGENASSVDATQFPSRLVKVTVEEVAPVATEAIEAGKSYLFTIFQNLRGEVLYFAGEMSGNYLATTDKLSKAVKVTIEEVVDGGYRMFFMDGEKKMYIDLTEGKGYIAITETPYEIFTWNAEAKTLVGTNSQKYLGTYKTYNTFSASAVSYITGENAANVDETQFPGRFCVIEFVK
ncbi:MAG: hypothetical protein MJ113_01395 [Lachnospiraceae bacterium]|nr:hypothetical protein [Lachnospiraceae bacterium]